MTEQSDPVDAPAAIPVAPSTGLACAFGTPWLAHFDGTGCSACDAFTSAGQVAFAAGVAAGRWDRDGYKPGEYKPLARVQAHRQPALFGDNGEGVDEDDHG